MKAWLMELSRSVGYKIVEKQFVRISGIRMTGGCLGRACSSWVQRQPSAHDSFRAGFQDMLNNVASHNCFARQ